MTKSFLVLAAALTVQLTLVACGKSDQEKDTGKKKPGYSGSFGTVEDEKVISEDQPTSDSCGSEDSTNMGVVGSSWTREFSTNVMNYRQSLTFLNDKMINRMDCSVNGVTARAETTASVNYLNGVIEITSTSSDSKPFTTGDQEYVCQANLNPALSFTFTARPNCLFIENGSEMTVFLAE